MKVAISCIGKFHHFDLARQLLRLGCLDVIYTSYPKWKLQGEGIPAEKLITSPWFQTLYMAQRHLPFSSLAASSFLAETARKHHDRFVARDLRPCDVFIGLSGHNLLAGRRARALGARWICDRGSTHIQHQDAVLRQEYELRGLPFSGVHPAVITQELAEYSEADQITIPAQHVEQTFLEHGVASSQLTRIPYGVDLAKFYPVGEPTSDGFDIVFVGGLSVRKGIPYLIEAFQKLPLPRKSLTLIGAAEPALEPWLHSVKTSEITITGPLPQERLKAYLSRSHVFVLPSVEEGLACVQAQALACGCPLLCTENTGGADLITPGVEGFVVPARDSSAIAERLLFLQKNPAARAKMSAAALRQVSTIGGWDVYGERMMALCNRLVQQSRS